VSAPSTADDFSRLVVENFNWRLKELSALKLAVSQARDRDRAGLLRSLVVMCYAHWEGHAKYCADLFIRYISSRRLQFSELAPHFYRVRFAREMSAHSSLSDKADLVEKILNSMGDRLSRFPRDVIDTRSNLNSYVLAEFCLVCGINLSAFDDMTDFLDRILLKRRNEIAHGEDVIIDVIEPDDLVYRTTKLMRTFRDQIDTAVTSQLYLAA